MNLPHTIAYFFRMKNAHEDDGLWTLFAPDPVIIDGGEGTEMRGADEIKKWIKKAISGLNLHTEIRKYEERDGTCIVDTVMSGDFKASPARFQYFITLRDGKISALRSEFIGSVKYPLVDPDCRRSRSWTLRHEFLVFRGALWLGRTERRIPILLCAATE